MSMMPTVPTTPDETKEMILALNGPYLFHGCNRNDVDSIFEHGLDPKWNNEFNLASAVWVATRPIADRYAAERSGGSEERCQIAVDLRLIPAEQLQADEELIFRIFTVQAKQRVREQCATDGISAPDEIEYFVDENYIDAVWEIFEEEVGDPDWARRPQNVWRSFAETGNLAIIGTVPPAAISRPN